ncbi:MAG: hypothetical protein ACRDTV_12590 [Mycobacterium sp.]
MAHLVAARLVDAPQHSSELVRPGAEVALHWTVGRGPEKFEAKWELANDVIVYGSARLVRTP